MTLYSGPLSKKIVPQPIVNVEVTFGFSKPDDHQTRLLSLYQAIAKEATGMEIVPVSRAPQSEANWFPFAEMRLGLRYSAAVIRPDSVQLDYGPSYPGWSSVREELWSIIQNLGTDLFPHVSDVSLRYINFFPSEPGIQDAIRVEVTTPFGEDIARRWLRFQIEDSGIRHDITCAEGVSVGSNDEHGVILDIASMMNPETPNADAIIMSLDRLHDQEKGIFMSMITSDYLSKLEVVY